VKTLTEEEVFDMLNKHSRELSIQTGRSNPLATALLADLKTLAKSHETLRYQARRMGELISEAHETLTKASKT
jgi:hypothetical protein